MTTPTDAANTESVNRAIAAMDNESLRAMSHVLNGALGDVLAPRVNPETLLGNKPASRESRVIDLRKRYDIHITPSPVGWEAVDYETYDPDPESRYCVTGSGKTTQEAVTDLLEQLAALVAEEIVK